MFLLLAPKAWLEKCIEVETHQQLAPHIHRPIGPGTRQLEAYRAKGRTITPRMEEFAKMLDSMEVEESMQLKPGVYDLVQLAHSSSTAEDCGDFV